MTPYLRAPRPLRLLRQAISAVPLFALLPVPPGLAQSGDAKGSKDNPLVKRYEGSTIIGYDFRKFDEFDLVLGPLQTDARGKLVPTKTQRVEGQVTRIMYAAPEGRSPLEVLRNYEQELQKGGFRILYKCGREECSRQDGRLADYLYPLGRRLSNTPPPGTGKPPGQVSEYALTSPKDQRYLSAKRTGSPADAYASVYVATGTFDMHPETFQHPIVLLDVVETAAMENKMVTVDAGTMAKDVAATGHVALYGIYFDTDKADLKPESAPTLEEIAKFLKQEPKMTLYVVGHTDNVGGYEYNMGLSERRAGAVVKELTTKHGVQAARLKPAGTGPLAPVAPNDTEDGRAKNRRVELVKQ
jgi:outer membrane protein OmpA-like peptidoglycan-associated protein